MGVPKWHNGLGIWSYYCCGADSIPNLGTFACCGHSQKKKKKKKKKKRTQEHTCLKKTELILHFKSVKVHKNIIPVLTT